ncbi:hypothetical protein PV10_01166 [Exophiala mesophila]|uniref:TEA domain-containing protein n=1 Tax=Exophiala mesophila TaxID=212818 RepID=A0A0D1Y9V0_EXOME|nr:uncharacterized protein PV10_01166 [Exophiala mesophila]KIV97411.1 hypothetical protein PV10_01166 [Exophiala mesophila]
MGKKKCSQHGRLFGRNMLIAEWIYRETGEQRTRKQVSSHAQVLNKFLQGTPEWDRVSRFDEHEPTTKEGHKFHHNSIEHMVNEQQRQSNDALKRSESLESDLNWEFDTHAQPSDHYILHSLSFYMRVSLAQDWDNALHNYTRLQCQSQASLPIPLEDVPNWRFDFPRLRHMIDEWPTGGRTDMVLLNTTFQLMDDFPPRRSKLGIDLELDFRIQDKEPFMGFSMSTNLTDWTCTTHLYAGGKLIQERAHEACRLSEDGKIKPFFLSKWWASQFTSLTEARKRAMESKDPNAISMNNVQVQNFFHKLSIMQEIWAVEPSPSGGKPSKVRVLILLWKFALTPDGFVGTTTWQNLIPPPERFATNSPFPTDPGMELPTLALDTMMDDSPSQGFFDRNNQFLGQPSLSYDLCPGGDEGDSLMSYKPEELGTYSQLNHESSHLISNNVDSLGQTDGTNAELNSMVTNDNTNNQAPNIEILHAQREQQQGQHQGSASYQEFEPTDHNKRLTSHGEYPLARFDVKCHQALQEQLGTNDERKRRSGQPTLLGEQHTLSNEGRRSPFVKMETVAENSMSTQDWTGIDSRDEVLRSALLAASAIEDRRMSLQAESSGAPQTPFHDQNRYDQMQNMPRWTSPLAVRPSLVSHHSFPGVMMPEHSHDSHRTFPLLTESLSTTEAVTVGQPEMTSLMPTNAIEVPHHANGQGRFSRAKSEPEPELLLDFEMVNSQQDAYTETMIDTNAMTSRLEAPVQHDWVNINDDQFHISSGGSADSQNSQLFSQNSGEMIFSQSQGLGDKIDLEDSFAQVQVEDGSV